MSLSTFITLLAIIILVILFFAGEELRTYFWIGLVLLIGWVAYCTFRGPRESEYCQQFIHCKNGGFIVLIHHGKCHDYHPLVKDIVEIKHYEKFKNHLYCSMCMDEMEMDIFDAVSYRNLWYGYIDDDAYQYYEDATEDARKMWYAECDGMIDTSHRKHTISYSRRGDELIPLAPEDIPEEYSYLRNKVR